MKKKLDPLVPDKKTPPIATPNHIHEWGEWTVTTPATCTIAGEETRICTLNSAHYETRPIAALGHDWGAWVVTKEPTITEEGEETRICKYDSSHIETRPIDRLPSGDAGINITFTQIAEGAPSLGGPVVIYRSPANGQTSYTFTLDNPEQYSSIDWYVDGIVTGSGETFTISSSNAAYNMTGTHVLTLEVVKESLLYTAHITFEVRQ